MRLIDADKLQPDRMTNRGTVAISQSQIANAPTVDVLEQKTDLNEAVRIAYEQGRQDALEVLDKIRAEIEQERDKVYQNRQGCDTYYADGLDTALEIIDKYKGE